LQNLQSVLAIELLTAAQAIEFHKPLECGKGTKAAYETIRKIVPPMETDRVVYDDVQMVLSLIKDGTLLKAVEDEVKLF